MVDLSRVNLTQLRAFDACARTLSFSKAAIYLGRSQATLSVQVRDLEQQLGVRLLDRTTRRVALTEAGEALSGKLKTGFDLIAEGVTVATEAARDRKGRAVIACVPSLSMTRLPTMLAKIRSRDTQTQIDIEEMTYVGMVEAIAKGSVDFGIGPCADPAPVDISFMLAVEDPLCILLRADHEAAVFKTAPMSLLASVPLIFLRGTAPLQSSLREVAQQHNIDISSRTTVRQVHTAIGMVRAGVGAAIIPRLALPDEIEDEFVALPIDNPPMVRRTGILLPAGRKLQGPAARLSRVLHGALASVPPLPQREDAPRAAIRA